LVFSRASSATRVASNGLIEKVRTNLFKYSEQFNQTSAWSFQGGATISANAGIAPDGTTTADLLYPSINDSVVAVIQAITSASSVEYTQSVYVKASGKNFVALYTFDGTTGAAMWVNLTTGAITNGVGTNVSGRFATNVGNGWWRIGFTDIGNGTTTYMHVYPTDAASSNSVTANGTDGILVWGAQLETGVATDYIATTSAAVSVGPVSGLPRLDYLNSTCPRLLLEPQRTNLASYSEQFDNAGWNKNNLTITANNLVSPDGYTNADTALETATSAFHDLIQNPSLTSGTTYTISSFVKAAGRDYCYLFLSDGTTPAAVKFNLATGVVLGTATGSPVSSKIENYGNGWYRCSMVYTSGATATGTLAVSATNSPALSLSGYAGDVTKGIAVYGAQLEASAYGTSYIPTLGTSVTRVADAASKTGISSLIGQTEGTLFAEFNHDISVTAALDTRIHLSSGTTANWIFFAFPDGGAKLLRFFINDSSGALSFYSSAPVVQGNNKVAFGYKSGDFVAYLNGVQVATNSTVRSIPVCSQIDLQGGAPNGVAQERANIEQALLFKTRLTNESLAALTSL
jgi:hypothetical protein